MFRDGEFEQLLALVRLVQNPKTMLEIGCHSGRTAAIMLREFPTLENYVGVDVPQGYKTSLPVQQKEIPANPGSQCTSPRFKVMTPPRGSFDLTVNQFGSQSMDIIFIDGDHGREAVLNDSMLAFNLIRLGGIIIWHDYNNSQAQVNEVIDQFDIKHVPGTWLAYKVAND